MNFTCNSGLRAAHALAKHTRTHTETHTHAQTPKGLVGHQEMKGSFSLEGDERIEEEVEEEEECL